MGLVINKTTNSSGYFDSFGRNFTWLNDTLHLLFKNVHRTNHVVQAESTQTCGWVTHDILHSTHDKPEKHN